MKKNIFIIALLSFFGFSLNSNAQSLSDLFNKENISKVVSAVSGSSEKANIVGKWSYSGSAVELKSSNILKNAGGKVATSTIENNLNKQLSKVGIQEGITSFDFKSDSTFTVTAKNKTQSGTYSLDTSANKLNLTFAGRATLAADVSISGNEMTVTFDADKLVTAVSYISKVTNNSSINTISSLLGSYDDVRSGFTLTKLQ